MKSGHVVGVLPRSIYGHDSEERAWHQAIDSAKGNIRATPVFANRRFIGVVQGRDSFLPDVRAVKLRAKATTREIEALLTEMDEERRLDSIMRARGPMKMVDIATPNDVIAAIAAGRFKRVWFQKTPTSAGVTFNWYDMWPVGGNPTSGAINGTARTAVIFDDTSTGTIPHGGNVSTFVKRMLSFMAWSASNTPTFIIYDRVLSYDQCTFAAGSLAMTNTATAARYMATGQGLIPMAVTNTTVLSALAANLTTFHYTNDANNAAQLMPTGTTVSLIVSSAAATAALGARVFAPSTSAQTVTWGYGLPLAVGDSGVRKIEDYTWSAANTGTASYPCIYPLAKVIAPVAGVPGEIELLYQIMEIPRIYDGAALSIMSYQPATSGAILMGSFSACWN